MGASLTSVMKPRWKARCAKAASLKIVAPATRKPVSMFEALWGVGASRPSVLEVQKTMDQVGRDIRFLMRSGLSPSDADLLSSIVMHALATAHSQLAEYTPPASTQEA